MHHGHDRQVLSEPVPPFFHTVAVLQVVVYCIGANDAAASLPGFSFGDIHPSLGNVPLPHLWESAPLMRRQNPP